MPGATGSWEKPAGPFPAAFGEPGVTRTPRTVTEALPLLYPPAHGHVAAAPGDAPTSSASYPPASRVWARARFGFTRVCMPRTPICVSRFSLNTRGSRFEVTTALPHGCKCFLVCDFVDVTSLTLFPHSGRLGRSSLAVVYSVAVNVLVHLSNVLQSELELESLCEWLTRGRCRGLSIRGAPVHRAPSSPPPRPPATPPRGSAGSV